MIVPAWLLNLWAFMKSPNGLRLVVLLAVVSLVGGAYLKGRSDKGADDRKALEAAAALAQVKDAHADAKADVQRATDQQTVTQHQEALTHADDAVPDSAPSAARRALACARLRAQSPSAAIPPECRSGG